MNFDIPRICFIQYRERIETNIYHLSGFLQKNGFDVTILNRCYTQKPDGLLNDGRRILYFKIPAPYNCRKSRIIFILKVIKYLKTNIYSILHVDSSCDYFVTLKIFWIKAKIVYHIQSYPLLNQRIKLFKRLLLVFIQGIFMDAIIIQSEEQKKKWYGIKNLKKVKVVPIGVNLSLFYPLKETEKLDQLNKLKINKNTKILIYSGAITEIRHIEKLILATKIVIEKYQDIKLLLVGNADNASRFKSMVMKMGLQEKIIFVGEVPHSEMNKIYGIADIGISFIPINSSFTCNPPLKSYEYLACGLPCIATKTISNCKIIRNGYNGILIQDNVEDTARAIISLLEDEKKREELKKNARNSILDYDYDLITKKFLVPIYREILKKSP